MNTKRTTNGLTAVLLLKSLSLAVLLLALLGAGGRASAATATFNSTDSRVLFFGRVITNFGTYKQLNALGSEVVTVVHGTDCSAQIYEFASGTLSLTYYDDAGTAHTSTPAVTTGSAQTVSVFSGLADDSTHPAGHLVIIKGVSGSPLVTISAYLSVTGAAPTISTPGAADGPGYGASALVAGGNVAVDKGSWQVTTTGNNYSSPSAYINKLLSSSAYCNDCRARIQGRGQVLRAWLYFSGGKYAWDIDGVHQGVVTSPNTNNYGWLTLGTIPDPAHDHVYGVTAVGGPTGGAVQCILDALMLTGGTISSATLAPQPGIANIGTSIDFANMSADGTTDSSQGYLYRLALAHGLAPYNAGISGNTVANMAARTGDITSISPAPKYVIYGGRANDLGNTQSPYQTSDNSVLSALEAGLPSTTIIYDQGAIPRGTATASIVATFNAWSLSDMQAAAAANPGKAALVFVDPTSWNMSGATYGSDWTTNYLTAAQDGGGQTHPNTTGYGIFVARYTPIIFPSITLFRHSSGSRAGSRYSY